MHLCLVCCECLASQLLGRTHIAYVVIYHVPWASGIATGRSREAEVSKCEELPEAHEQRACNKACVKLQNVPV